ncbi:hypothetical protein HanIR_Chr05g0208281 [Helianthus annuus]|nr:hypothetical protein HanIR_Chr05g0208281 [Helianthus annuus]
MCRHSTFMLHNFGPHTTLKSTKNLILCQLHFLTKVFHPKHLLTKYSSSSKRELRQKGPSAQPSQAQDRPGSLILSAYTHVVVYGFHILQQHKNWQNPSSSSLSNKRTTALVLLEGSS